MERDLKTVGEDIAARKLELMALFRERVRADVRLPEQRLALTDSDLEADLPDLLDHLIGVLKGGAVPRVAIHEQGARHGRLRAGYGYTISQLIVELAIFKKAVRRVMETRERPAEELFAARELVIELVDLSQISSVQAFVNDTVRERDRAREELRLANALKERFLFLLPHELSNPLSAIRTAVHILRSDRVLSTDKQRAMEILDHQVMFQRRLVDDLLDVNRISRGIIGIRKEPIELKAAIERAIETYLSAIEAKSIIFHFKSTDQQLPVLADPVRIEQVVANLLANALKFTPAGGSIEIRLEREADSAIAHVRDTGSGFESSMTDRLFDLFDPARNSSPDNDLGIGLWLAKSLVEMHGGTIRARSEGIDKGAEFSVTLPLWKESLEGKARPKSRVLIVEDNPDQRELMLLALSEMDWEVSCAKDASEALEMANRGRYAVYILDIGLPDMTGYDLAGRLLRIHGADRPLLIALTGYGRPEDIAKAKASGFDHHLVKPADIEDLERIVSRHLARK
jgi:signal transduction histidine kinase/ActR/RegA family two-component response regulator